jgi:hypothetical protein
MDSDILLFISSTSDLKAERQALKDAEDLRDLCNLFLYEDFGAGSDEEGNTSPESILREKLEKSDVFVCLLGPRHGSLYKPPVDKRSIVEWEFDTAQTRRLVIMPFRKTVPKEQIEPSQLGFISRVSAFREEDGGRWGGEFDSPETLVKLVRESLVKWLGRQYKKTQAQVVPWLNRILAPLAIGLVLLCIVVSTLFMLQVVTFSKSSVFGFCVIIFFTLLLCFMAFLSQTGGRNVPTR